MVRHVTLGVGRIDGFPDCQIKTMKIPYLRGLPDDVSMKSDGKTLYHKRFGEESVACIIVFDKKIKPMSHPSAFIDNLLIIK